MTNPPPQIINPDHLYEMANKHGVELRLWPKDWEDEKENILNAAQELSKIWHKKPFDNNNGVQGLGSLTLSYYLKKYTPQLLVESGCWRGFSTWVMEQASPQTQFICLDPVLSFHHMMDKRQYEPVYRTQKARYASKDFSTVNFGLSPEQRENAIVFFDDHQDKLPRLMQARAQGFKRFIFDDDLPMPYTHVTFQNNFNDPAFIDKFFPSIKRYELMPPPYSVPYFRDPNFQLQGLDLPKTEDLAYLGQDNAVYSWISFVELK